MQRLLIVCVVAGLTACGSSSKKSVKPVTDVSSDAGRGEKPASGNEVNKGDMTVSTDTGDDLSWLTPIYFAFDSAELLPATRATLERLSSWLAAHPKVSLTIEGHCDEQGTTEYNVALGQRRAQAIADYLSRLGTDAQRLTATSYGSLRPAVDGHDEVAWAKNRRGEFRVGQ